MVCVQRKTPDDGQRNCLKHVEFYSKNIFEKLVHLVGFIIRPKPHNTFGIVLQCTVEIIYCSCYNKDSYLQLKIRSKSVRLHINK